MPCRHVFIYCIPPKNRYILLRYTFGPANSEVAGHRSNRYYYFLEQGFLLFVQK
ncbi:hypothetical protein KDK_74760 [Dictyobacter kobayashii]|uniref:Uncharacterized protein n=1 Tax=Dictyobacter kobayashii TaxID=2014872 RepID=A0A402AX48_9CHLR|nr:hypothetical protein KDK_74760 [Dictyobacter kobayashii]